MTPADDVVDLLRELVARRSENPPGEEAAVAAYLAERLAASPVPFDVAVNEVEPDRPNVVARAGDPSRGSVLLTGHVDVVPADPETWSGDPYELRERDGRVVGRGVSDMKGALAAKLLAAERYHAAAAAPGEVVLAFVVDEEVHGAGSRALVDRGLDVDAALVGEPSRLQVAVAQKGVVRYELTVRGRSGHAGSPADAVNALSGAGRVLRRLEAFDARLGETTEHPLLQPETLTVTELSGGIAPNVVPDAARLTVDWRLLPGRTDPEALDAEMRDLVAGVSVDGVPLDVDVERLVYARPAEIPRDHELARTTVEAARAAGVDADVVGFDAVTDARFLVNEAGVPTVVCGPGSIEDDAHTVDESVSVSDLRTTVDVYRETLSRLLS